MNSKKLSIGSDHGGLELKNSLVKSLEAAGFEVSDRGCFTKDSVDYPDYAKTVCADVVSGAADFGVLICTTGIGMSIAANKIRGIRAALCLYLDSAEFSRRHNNANVCCLGAKYLTEASALEIVEKFAATDFDGGRHERRVAKFAEFENA